MINNSIKENIITYRENNIMSDEEFAKSFAKGIIKFTLNKKSTISKEPVIQWCDSYKDEYLDVIEYNDKIKVKLLNLEISDEDVYDLFKFHLTTSENGVSNVFYYANDVIVKHFKKDKIVTYIFKYDTQFGKGAIKFETKIEENKSDITDCLEIVYGIYHMKLSTNKRFISHIFDYYSNPINKNEKITIYYKDKLVERHSLRIQIPNYAYEVDRNFENIRLLKSNEKEFFVLHDNEVFNVLKYIDFNVADEILKMNNSKYGSSTKYLTRAFIVDLQGKGYNLEDLQNIKKMTDLYVETLLKTIDSILSEITFIYIEDCLKALAIHGRYLNLFELSSESEYIKEKLKNKSNEKFFEKYPNFIKYRLKNSRVMSSYTKMLETYLDKDKFEIIIEDTKFTDENRHRYIMRYIKENLKYTKSILVIPNEYLSIFKELKSLNLKKISDLKPEKSPYKKYMKYFRFVNNTPLKENEIISTINSDLKYMIFGFTDSAMGMISSVYPVALRDKKFIDKYIFNASNDTGVLLIYGKNVKTKKDIENIKEFIDMCNFEVLSLNDVLSNSFTKLKNDYNLTKYTFLREMLNIYDDISLPTFKETSKLAKFNDILSEMKMSFIDEKIDKNSYNRKSLSYDYIRVFDPKIDFGILEIDEDFKNIYKKELVEYFGWDLEPDEDYKKALEIHKNLFNSKTLYDSMVAEYPLLKYVKERSLFDNLNRDIELFKYTEAMIEVGF